MILTIENLTSPEYCSGLPLMHTNLKTKNWDKNKIGRKKCRETEDIVPIC